MPLAWQICLFAGILPTLCWRKLIIPVYCLTAHISSTLQNNGHSLFVHCIPGHKDFKGNELADCLAKNAAKEMIGKKEDFFEGVADRSILLTLKKQEVTEKWQKIYVNSPKSDTLQDVITEVGKSEPSIGDRNVEAIINQPDLGSITLKK